MELLPVVRTCSGGRAVSHAVNEPEEPQIAILLCTFDGERFLASQLDSFAAQSHVNWRVWASDDGSGDATLALLAHYQARWGSNRLCVRRGPNRGAAANFLSLVCSAEVEADYYAYSDQDDVWCADKLARGRAWLDGIDADVPALYCSRTLMIDADDREIGFSRLFRRPPSFTNALVQNIAGGNTMIFNGAARRLIMAAGHSPGVVSHDWWTYILVTGAGGRVFYDPNATIRYRQHERNLVGSNRGILPKVHRIRELLRGRFKEWNDANTAALVRCRHCLTDENLRVFHAFHAARNRWLLPRASGIWRSGVRRQTLLGNLGIAVAAVFDRV
jgi:glycosyltransferase involved in cell wall biosynthesis